MTVIGSMLSSTIATTLWVSFNKLLYWSGNEIKDNNKWKQSCSVLSHSEVQSFLLGGGEGVGGGSWRVCALKM